MLGRFFCHHFEPDCYTQSHGKIEISLSHDGTMAHDKIQAMHVKISSYVLADNSLDSQEFLQHPSFKTFSGVDILSKIH